MATILLAAAGGAAGSAIGGSVFGVSAAVAGRAIGATLGKVIDQRLLGTGSQAIESGRVERFRLTGAGEGAPIAQVYGRMRVGGQVIWATQFQENVATTGGGGKGAPSQPKTRTYSYSVSLAIALCEGEISRVGRIWADGAEIARNSLNLRVYTGSEEQLPDPKIEAVEGAGLAPSYRGIAYVVIENLDLSAFGNRVPQFTFEVVKPVSFDETSSWNLSDQVSAVALMPGTGEYALATSPVYQTLEFGETKPININSPSGSVDLVTSMDQLSEELPKCESVSLIVSWFGNDLRCGNCTIMPKVEQTSIDGEGMPWTVNGIGRLQAQAIPRQDGRVIYGGTPCDASVVQALHLLKNSGKSAMFYPFVLMEQISGNGLPDPWGDAEQPVLPWRGRITTSIAPSGIDSPDGTAAAEAEVAAFFGVAQPSDFVRDGTNVSYVGPEEFSYRRFVLHYAHLCAAAGGISAFCIGSELRSLTQIRGAGGSFPAVAALCQLAADVRSILGAETKISYAADWSEYFGYRPQDGSNDVLFHLDPLWADPNIDFIGIDNYMPLSDWRDTDGHADESWGAIYNVEYLCANVAGGEGYDWYYASPSDREVQNRSPITDGADGEPWVYRYKDIRNWWSNPHHNRIGGVRQATPTAWLPQSKPVWFTELGCAAIDKGTNQPNKFLDPKSSESELPHFSDGRRDDLIQVSYLAAMTSYWGDEANNPVSAVYSTPMVDMSRAHVWAWDARPFPHFPLNRGQWSDGENYARGHWLNGRSGNQALAAVVKDICARSGMEAPDVTRLYGTVRGYSIDKLDTARASLQPLMLAFGFDVIEHQGQLVFEMRGQKQAVRIDGDALAWSSEIDAGYASTRAPSAEKAGKVRLSYVEADRDFETRTTEAIRSDEPSLSVSQSEVPLALTSGESLSIVERWLSEAEVARDTVRFALPPSARSVRAGGVVHFDLPNLTGTYRVDQVEQAGAQIVEAVRVEPQVYKAAAVADQTVPVRDFVASSPVTPVFLDLPLLRDGVIPHAPYLGVKARPWQGDVAVYGSSADEGYQINTMIERAVDIGVTETELHAADSGRWDNGAPLRVKLRGGTFSSAQEQAVLNGANTVAIGDGVSQNWELFQFAQAELVSEETFELSRRLRGQLGTDALMPESWPAGSLVVVLDSRLTQIDLPLSSRGLERHYRIGSASKAYDDPSFVHKVAAFEGIGLRPYAPCHLSVSGEGNEDRHVSWIRRTRIDGDNWSGMDVPLGEDSEAYLVQVLEGADLRREEIVSQSGWTYTAAKQTQDGVSAPYSITIAQISDQFGPGPVARIEIND